MDSSDAYVRVSDADRAHVRQLLEHAVGQGLLTLDEFGDRVERVFTARTRGELRAVLADLPKSPTVAPHSGEPIRGRMSTVTRRGPWTVPSHLRLNTRMCDTTLDFTNAAVSSPSVVLDVDDYFSSTELILPDGATADLNGVDTFAGSATLKVPYGPRSSQLHLVVRGRVRFGSVTARYSYGRVWRRMLG